VSKNTDKFKEDLNPYIYQTLVLTVNIDGRVVIVPNLSLLGSVTLLTELWRW